MEALFSQLFAGLSLGSVLLLAALGLALTFGQMGVINMAHGEFMMAGAYTAYVVQDVVTDAGISLLLAIPLGFGVGGVLGVVLTGMGQDGLRGSEEIVSAGGRLLAQSTGSSVVASMPGAVADLADVVVPLGRVAEEIASLAGRSPS